VLRTGEGQHRAFQALTKRALEGHVEGDYRGRILLVRATDRRPPPGRTVPMDLRWGEVVSGPLEVVPVPGAHGDLTKAPFVGLVAEVVVPVLRRFDTDGRPTDST
jgi:thioesterase domain-containing protein